MRRMGEERNVLLGHEWWIRRNMIYIDLCKDNFKF